MLPNDILFIIFEQIRETSDFYTLLQCSLSCKTFAAAALPNLWRIHDTAPCSSNGTEEAYDLKKWLSLWRVLILSSYPGTTYMEYIRYIRVLSLRDLESLFDAYEFGLSNLSKLFLNSELEEFYPLVQNLERVSKHRFREWQAANAELVAAIGDRITECCFKLAILDGRKSVLEELDCGKISSKAMQKMVPRIPELRTIRVYRGNSLTSLAPMIRENCPKFGSLTFYEWTEDNTDELFAEFLKGILPQTLHSLEVAGSSLMKELSAAALSEHNTSLVNLRITNTESGFLQSLPRLGSCTQLTTAHFEFGQDWDASDEELEELSDWLSSCTAVKELELLEPAVFNMVPTLLTTALVSNIRLTRLEVGVYVGQSTEFHNALVAQAESLQCLALTAEAEDMDVSSLSDSLAHLKKLHNLQLRGVADFFQDFHIVDVANSLPLLEEFVVGGWNITDSVWPALARLRLLRRLELNAFSTFTLYGILGFVNSLKEGNRGLALTITLAHPMNQLQDEEQVLVRNMLVERVGEGGRFVYEPARDPNATDTESDSD